MFKKSWIGALLLAAATLVSAQVPAPQTVRLRATIEKVEPGSITVKERSGEVNGMDASHLDTGAWCAAPVR